MMNVLIIGDVAEVVAIDQVAREHLSEHKKDGENQRDADECGVVRSFLRHGQSILAGSEG